jgi:hypothetical protein
MSDTVSETLADVGDAADAAGKQTVRVPANLLRMVRQSYDSREKVLDWMLAIGVVATLSYVFRDEIRGCIWPGVPDDPNAGRADEPTPNQDVADAFPGGGMRPGLYTYNMPPARNFRYSAAPSGTRPPHNPSMSPGYSTPQ